MSTDGLSEKMQEVRRHVAANVRRAREATGLTIVEAARRARVNANVWKAIELARHGPKLSTACKIARALGVTPVDLFKPAPDVPDLH